MKGALTSFGGGVFQVDTDFGEVSIEADKLDYIIVEESDPGPSPCKGDFSMPGMELGPDGQAEPGVAETVAGVGTFTQVPPRPLESMSVRPDPNGTWSVKGAGFYPGRFSGGR